MPERSVWDFDVFDALNGRILSGEYDNTRKQAGKRPESAERLFGVSVFRRNQRQRSLNHV